ncbi:hypothetical protein [uncultured Gammaproteobacteria bacterium]|nr:hypothetical protein [uncultured Gammaproteobacteria bacterium]
MAKLNERETENIVRQHFQKDKLFKDIIFEEQSSNNPRITKLLKNASKKSNGIGKPEFIISIDDEKDLLIVVECKADILKHESKNRDKFTDYAVDGVLLYSSYLSKEYDILSLAVSGVEKDNIKVSYFIQRVDKEAEQIFGNRLITIDDILAGLRQDVAKRDEKYEELLDYSQLLNKQLHKLKIKEDKRSLLVSGILIALKNQDFYRSYSGLSSNQMLANALVDTIKEQLLDEELQGDKIDRLMENYSFIKSHPSLIHKNKKKELKDLNILIDEIDDKINGYSRTYKYYDVLGQFYIEFLRYSNADKGLGIVLTPPHITEFFTDIVDIKTDDIVFDNCTGTSGFLVSSMKKMIDECNGDLTKEESIKKNQLFGIEYQPEIYPLAVSNMLLHGDGKSNILSGSCFDENIIKTIKEKKPTVGFLNPPYKSDKTDVEEFEFILNNLECLEKHSQCVVIIPMSCALAQKGERLRLKHKLLSKHRLKAVFSMPDELFHNSKVGTNTCIMVFEAHITHSEKKNTFFGYFKNDGFTKRKEKGRFDYNKFWGKIKDEWLDLYINSTPKEGFSVVKKISAKDEWCAESYMETNYLMLNDNYFTKTLLVYLSFMFKNKLSKNVSNDRYSNINIIFEVDKWQYFELSTLFAITGSKTTPVLDLEEYGNGKSPYITTQATNNGVGGFYDFYSEKGNCLTVDSAVLGYCSYQKDNFSASDHVEKLIPNFEMNKYIALFLTTILNLEQYRYNYGRKCSQTRMKEISIKLPTKNNQPDWQFMEDYIKSLPYSKSL